MEQRKAVPYLLLADTLAVLHGLLVVFVILILRADVLRVPLG